MPTPGATTTAMFASVGITPSEIYTTFTNLIGSAVSFGLWMIQVSWPFLLVIAFLYLMWSLASHFLHFGRSGQRG